MLLNSISSRDALDNPGGGKGGYSILEKPELGSDHLSDDSSKGAMSDSHPDTLTDPEHSDPPANTSSPPQSGDEVQSLKRHFFTMYVQVRRAQERAERREEKRGSKHFMKDMTFSIKSQAKASNLNKVGWTGLVEHENKFSLSGKLFPQQHSLATLPLNHSLFPSFG